MKLNRSRLLIAALVIPVALIAATPSPASAVGQSELVGTTTGGGYFYPGLTAIPNFQAFSVSGTLTVTGRYHGTPVVLGKYPVFAYGNDLAGNYAEGAGLFMVNFGTYDIQWSGVFIRVGMNLQFSVSATGPSGITETNGHLVLVPHQLPPATVTSYKVTGAVDLVATY